MFVLFEKEYLAEEFTEFALDIDCMVYFSKQGEKAIDMLNDTGAGRVVTFKDEASRDKYWDKIMSIVVPSMPPCLRELLDDLANNPGKLKVTKIEAVKKKKVAKKNTVKKKPDKKELIIKPVKKKAVKKK